VLEQRSLSRLVPQDRFPRTHPRWAIAH
jgi:hypothetical protein